MSQFFEQALAAKLQSITALTAILGTQVGGGAAIFTYLNPQTWDFGNNGPALTYSIPVKPKGQVLAGGDGTAMPRVQLDAWSYFQSDTKQIIAAIYNGINGVPVNPWGDGTCVIMAVVQIDDTELDEVPKAGTDQPIFHTMSEYFIQYRLIPTGG